MNKAIFLDRDGVIIEDNSYLTSSEKMIIYQGVSQSISKFKKSGFLVIGITNQPVVARGMITEDQLFDIHEDLKLKLKSENKNAIIDKIYYCPHHPDAQVEKYKIDCDCRKPKPGMLLRAIKEFQINPTESFMVGDRITDIAAGKLSKCKTVLIESGMHKSEPIKSNLTYDKELKPDFKFKSLLEMINII